MEAVVIYMEPVLWFMKTLLELAATLHLQAAVRSWGRSLRGLAMAGCEVNQPSPGWP